MTVLWQRLYWGSGGAVAALGKPVQTLRPACAERTRRGRADVAAAELESTGPAISLDLGRT
ncbi:MAG: hypothetical protein D6753_11955 [Planctomycetota bacterium]|nr:MAG: hypothetical protein D6753_11955 [Planctomycetota bacterium]